MADRLTAHLAALRYRSASAHLDREPAAPRLGKADIAWAIVLGLLMAAIWIALLLILPETPRS